MSDAQVLAFAAGEVGAYMIQPAHGVAEIVVDVSDGRAIAEVRLSMEQAAMLLTKLSLLVPIPRRAVD